MIQDRTEHLRGIRRNKDTCLIDEALVYGSTECARAWTAVSRSADYPYYLEELELVHQLSLRTASKEPASSHRLIAIGPADSAKELALLRSIQFPLSSPIYLIDNSHHLLKVAARSFKSAGYKSIVSICKDVSQYASSESRVQSLANGCSHSMNIVTCFGNTVGNYSGLDLIDLMPALENENTILIFGFHVRELLCSNRYSAYYSDEYINHMRLVVASTGLKPDDGIIEVVIRPDYKDSADIIEHFFKPSDAQVATISEHIDFHGWGGRVLIDQSAKLDSDFVRGVVQGKGYSIASEMIHSSGRVCLLVCRGGKD